jgi:phosphatidylinositol glycan class Q protein
MHPVSILTFGIFFAGYITARWDLVTRLYELAIFAWDHGVIVCRSTPALKETLMAKNLPRHALPKALPSCPSSSYSSSSLSSASPRTNPIWSVRYLQTLPLSRQSLTTRRNRVHLKVVYPRGNNYEEEARSDQDEGEACFNTGDTLVHLRRSLPHKLLAMVL